MDKETPSLSVILNSFDWKWRGGLPLPGGYQILDEAGNEIFLFWSEIESKKHIELSALIRSALGCKKENFLSNTVDKIRQYLHVKDGVFVLPE
jgi:hypothetical protein